MFFRWHSARGWGGWVPLVSLCLWSLPNSPGNRNSRDLDRVRWVQSGLLFCPQCWHGWSWHRCGHGSSSSRQDMGGCIGRPRKVGRERNDGAKRGMEHYWLSEHGPATHSRLWEACRVSSCGRGGESVTCVLMAWRCISLILCICVGDVMLHLQLSQQSAWQIG